MGLKLRLIYSILLIALFAETGCKSNSNTHGAQVKNLRGTALNAKGGAILQTAQGDIYLHNLSAWPEYLVRKTIETEGTLSEEQYLNEAFVDETGAISQGAVGKQWVLRNYSFRLVAKDRPSSN